MCLSLLLCSAAAVAQAPEGPRAKAERDLFERAVEIPTVAGRREMPRLTRLLADEFRGVGITDIQIKPHGDTQTMIVRWPAVRPSGKKPILLMAHMDVVEALRSDWTHDPFEFREAEGYYWGRGTSDNKAGMVAIVAVLKRLKQAGFQTHRDIIVLFTGDEETAQDGARLASTEWRALIDAEYALNSDSGGGAVFRDGRVRRFNIQTAEKVYSDFRFVATNRGGHSSVPRADNAIYPLAGALKNLEEYRFTPILSETTRGAFEETAAQDGGSWGATVRAWLDDPTNAEKADLVEMVAPGSTRTRCIATQLGGGHAPNALPQRAQANVNCRIFPGTSIESVQRELQAVAGQNVKVEIAEAGVPSEASPLREDVVAAFRSAIRRKFPDAPVVPSQSAGATDGAYTRGIGIPTYGVGAGWGWMGDQSGAHGLNERVPIKSFHDQIDIWEDMLRTLAV
jgi:acetylornithine deacetylase/succinyl-diaminopimelate desuccinylase-like protein